MIAAHAYSSHAEKRRNIFYVKCVKTRLHVRPCSHQCATSYILSLLSDLRICHERTVLPTIKRSKYCLWSTRHPELPKKLYLMPSSLSVNPNSYYFCYSKIRLLVLNTSVSWLNALHNPCLALLVLPLYNVTESLVQILFQRPEILTGSRAFLWSFLENVEIVNWGHDHFHVLCYTLIILSFSTADM